MGLNETKISAKTLIEQLPSELHHSLSKELNLDDGIDKLTSRLLFDLILYSLLSCSKLSLRQMSSHAEDSSFAFLSRVALNHLAYTTIRTRLIQIDSSYFERLYEHLYQQIRERYPSRTLLGKYHLKRYDSTMIAVFAHLIQGMRVGNSSKNKRQIKFCTEQSGDGLLQMFFFSDQSHLSEETTLKEVIEARNTQLSAEQDQIIVFDAGLKSRDSFEQFDQQNLLFITRLQGNPRYRVIEKTPDQFVPIEPEQLEDLPQSAEVIDDQLVLLAKNANNWSDHPFRLIRLNIGQEQPLHVITNILTIPPKVIAAIYRMRWEIEVLFRFLKQEMHLKHLVCYHPNAIKVMMYGMLIAAMLVLLFKKQNQINSYRKARITFFNQLKAQCLLQLLEQKQGIEFIKERIQVQIRSG